MGVQSAKIALVTSLIAQVTCLIALVTSQHSDFWALFTDRFTCSQLRDSTFVSLVLCILSVFYFFVLFFLCTFYLWCCVFLSLSAGRQPTWAGSTVRSSQHLLPARHCLLTISQSFFANFHILLRIIAFLLLQVQVSTGTSANCLIPHDLEARAGERFKLSVYLAWWQYLLLLYASHRKIKLSQEQEKSRTGFAPDLINSRQCIERDTLRKGRKNDGKKSRSPIVGNHNFSAPIAEQSACWKNTEIPVHVRFHRTRSKPPVSIGSDDSSPSQKPMSSRSMDFIQQML